MSLDGGNVQTNSYYWRVVGLILAERRYKERFHEEDIFGRVDILLQGRRYCFGRVGILLQGSYPIKCARSRSNDEIRNQFTQEHKSQNIIFCSPTQYINFLAWLT